MSRVKEEKCFGKGGLGEGAGLGGGICWWKEGCVVEGKQAELRRG